MGLWLSVFSQRLPCLVGLSCLFWALLCWFGLGFLAPPTDMEHQMPSKLIELTWQTSQHSVSGLIESPAPLERKNPTLLMFHLTFD